MGLLYGERSYKDDALFLDVFNDDSITNFDNPNIIKIRPYVFSPEDLIISKLFRWASNDRNDAKELIQLELVDQDIWEEKIEDALIDYICLDTFLRYNIKELKDYFFYLRRACQMTKATLLFHKLYMMKLNFKTYLSHNF